MQEGDRLPYGSGYGSQTPQEASGGASRACSVTDALNILKGALKDLRLNIVGEVSELSDKPGYKAVYFTICDEQSALSCLMWKNVYEAACRKNGFALEPGMLIEVSGSFTVYAAKGRMNFDVRSFSLAGEGNLRAKVAALAKKLDEEGLMRRPRKPLPYLPEKVAVVTSPRGKAVHDCLRTLKRRFPLTEVLGCGVAVEGRDAPAEIIHGLNVAAESEAEVILLVRGGGSYEDLMPFNDENLARAVANCRKPVVTGIGHEPDNSICDMVADLRCSTPTAAAEAVVPDMKTVYEQLSQQEARLAHSLGLYAERAQARWDSVATRPLFTMPEELLSSQFLAHDSIHERLNRAIPNALAADNQRLELALSRFRGLSAHLIEPHAANFALEASRLEDLSPLSILTRGYSATYNDKGGIVSSVKQVSEGDDVAVRVSDGFIDARVTGTRVPADDEVGGTDNG